MLYEVITQVSTNGGVHPLWSRDGKELFYLDLAGGTQGRGDLAAQRIVDENPDLVVLDLMLPGLDSYNFV